MNKLFALIISLIISPYVFAQQAGIPKNQSFTISTENLKTGDLFNNEQYSYIFKSLGKIEQDQLFECRLVRAVLKELNDQPAIINTDSLSRMGSYNSNVLPILALLNQPFQVRLNSKNKIVEVNGVKEILENNFKKWVINDETARFYTNYSEKSLAEKLQLLFLQIPEKKPGFGSSWTNEENHMQYKVVGVKGALLTINSTYADEQYGQLQGKIVYNAINGLSESIELSGKPITTVTKANGEQNNLNISWKYSQHFDRQTKTYTVDTAWISMAVKLGHWSNALKTAGEYDSLKVANFMNENAMRFEKDSYYRRTILSAVQSVKGNNSHLKYYELLNKTPNEYLAGETSHLHNKMHGACEESAETAYAIVPYIHKLSTFSDWIHMSYAQAFLSRDDEGYRKREAKAYQLAELLHQDKSKEVQQQTQALYLWVKAKQQPQNAALLLKTADEFKKMNDANMKAGNGGRYSLLVYNLLWQTQKNKEAAGLLDNVIEKLTKYTLDTLNKQRYEHQYLLSHAYYLKSEAAKATDSLQSMQYLSQAARYSAKNPKEKAYASFYDRAFLNSKESYLEDFMNQLLKMGNQEEALKVFVDQINIAPENLEEMQKVYQTKFPNNSFAQFFRKEIMSAWNAAPDFTLTGLKEEKYNLADYQKNWLLIDFWGTWCAPCREEMPSLNQFNEELLEGKHPKIQFLSVACYDRPKAVEEYFAANDFRIPVAMSDNSIEKNYEIRGYPSKIIISPEGKMTTVEFGRNWRNILKKYIELYEAE